MRKNRVKKEILHPEVTNRARSVSIGTAFGGIVEISMRRADGNTTFAYLQPVEAIELIHQLSASVGCHIHLVPRKDFASWREWQHTESELKHFRGEQYLPGSGHPPQNKSDISDEQKATAIASPEEQPGLNQAFMARGNNDEIMAIKKPKNRRNAKRASVAA